jgi:hypothetical protein
MAENLWAGSGAQPRWLMSASTNNLRRLCAKQLLIVTREMNNTKLYQSVIKVDYLVSYQWPIELESR